MKLLLDTHIFIWYITNDRLLREEYYGIIQNPENEVFLSNASFWEAVIKYQTGKLNLPESAHTYFPAKRREHFISSLEINEHSIARLPDMPNAHKDPFDRIIICQAIEHDMTLISSDRIFRDYPVKSLL